MDLFFMDVAESLDCFAGDCFLARLPAAVLLASDFDWALALGVFALALRLPGAARWALLLARPVPAFLVALFLAAGLPAAAFFAGDFFAEAFFAEAFFAEACFAEAFFVEADCAEVFLAGAFFLPAGVLPLAGLFACRLALDLDAAAFFCGAALVAFAAARAAAWVRGFFGDFLPDDAAMVFPWFLTRESRFSCATPGIRRARKLPEPSDVDHIMS